MKHVFGLILILTLAADMVIIGRPGAACGQAPPKPASPNPAASPPTELSASDIERLIQQLGAAGYKERMEATRRLCEIGPMALDALRAARAHESFEVATRAALLVQVLEQVCFAGVKVTLRASAERVAWNEPFDVILEMENLSSRDARVPFDLSGGAPSRSGASEQAQQVGIMLDAGDMLHVTDVSGRPIALRIDDIGEDPDVRGIVDRRAASSPVSTLKPGEKATVLLPQFNRGFARYPLLRPGRATVRFEYIPDWPEEEPFENFVTQGVGAVRSTAITIDIEPGAPETLSLSGRMADLTVTRDGDDLVAKLTCVYDKPIHVNLLFGYGLPFAQGRWICRVAGEDRILPFSERECQTLTDFARDRLVPLEPGASIELGRVPLAKVRKVCEADAATAQACEIIAVYGNQASRAWQNDQSRRNTASWKAMPATVREPFPERLLTAHLQSEPMPLPQQP